MDTDYQLVSFGCRLLFNIFSNRPAVRGRENIEELDPPYIVACNHVSNIDPALMLGYYPEPVRFLAKAELARLPWIGFIERRLGNIHLERDGRDIGAIRQALSELRGGARCLVTFRGGRRTGGDGLDDAKNGAAMLAALDEGRSAPPREAWLPYTVGVVAEHYHRLLDELAPQGDA